MIGLIITGHGTFPIGLLSAIELIGGQPEQLLTVNFEAGQSSEELKLHLKQAIEKLDTDELLFLSDLTGGTPFNIASLLAKEITDKKVDVISGTNLPMLVEAVFSRQLMEFDVLISSVKKAGMESITALSDLTSQEEPIFEDGL